MSSPGSPSLPNDLPIEIEGPDITSYEAGNTGVPFVWSFEAAEPGPQVMVTAIVHGNEPCGAIALDDLLKRRVRPVRGRLTLGFMNVAAYQRFDPADPHASRWVDEDFNRLWAPGALDDGDSVERQRAREVRAIVASVDYLLDIHSMSAPSPAMMMAGWQDRGIALARRVGVPSLIVADRGHAAGMRMRDHGAFAADGAEAAALLVECGQHWETAAATRAIETTARFLAATGAVPGDLPPPPPQQVFDVTEAVTITADRFTFAEAFQGGEVLGDAGTLIGHDGDRPVVTPYPDCMLVMPGTRLWQGMTAVRLARARP